MGARNLAEERAQGRRPYFIHVDAAQIWGWRQASTMPGAPLTQVRIHEYTTRPLNDFGEEQIEQMRVIYPGKYDLYTLGQDVVEFSQTGGYSLPAATASTKSRWCRFTATVAACCSRCRRCWTSQT
jgi:hypothetical protein